MLVTSRVAKVLEERREDFRRTAEDSSLLLGQYLDALRTLRQLPRDEIEQQLAKAEWPGARPSREFEIGRLIVPFEKSWDSAQEARAWAASRLRGIPTVAVDGSQVAASKELALPISLVQVAWFENYHEPETPYVKDVRNEIITQDEPREGIEDFPFPESKLNQRRFELELQIAVERIEGLAASPPPVVFIDGSFVLSFVGRMAPQLRKSYLSPLFRLLDASRERHIPVVGYVDLSLASDMLSMLRTLFHLPLGSVFDARLLASSMSSFDRTVAFHCARGDVLPYYKTDDRDYGQDLCFVYLKTGHEGFPARLDFPRWILDEGLLDHVVDVARAEVVVGSGYPYALETADAAAVLTSEDRMAFYRLFHQFAHASGLKVSLPGKSISKMHRR